MPSYIYVMSYEDKTKIGITSDPYSRRVTIKHDAGEEYEPKALWECDEARILDLENKVVSTLRDKCFRGREWFYVDSEYAISTVTRIAHGMNCPLQDTIWPDKAVLNKITFYLDDDIAEEVNRIRRERRPIPSMNKLILELIVDGLPTGSRLELHRARRAKREGKA